MHGVLINTQQGPDEEMRETANSSTATNLHFPHMEKVWILFGCRILSVQTFAFRGAALKQHRTHEAPQRSAELLLCYMNTNQETMNPINNAYLRRGANTDLLILISPDN